MPLETHMLLSGLQPSKDDLWSPIPTAVPLIHIWDNKAQYLLFTTRDNDMGPKMFLLRVICYAFLVPISPFTFLIQKHTQAAPRLHPGTAEEHPNVHSQILFLFLIENVLNGLDTLRYRSTILYAHICLRWVWFPLEPEWEPCCSEHSCCMWKFHWGDISKHSHALCAAVGGAHLSPRGSWLPCIQMLRCKLGADPCMCFLCDTWLIPLFCSFLIGSCFLCMQNKNKFECVFFIFPE